MADAERRGDVVWEGSLAQGSGTITFASEACGPLPVTWASRTARSDGKTSPEELVAAAHAGFYCMALSHILDERGTPPEKLATTATVTFAAVESGHKVASSAISVTGAVPGMDAAAFAEAATAAKDGCPISGALKGNVAISVAATLA
jgi:osmotically inducible protein OsmC